MIVRIYIFIKRRICLFLVNKVFVGTNPHFFKLKRHLLNSIGYSIGLNTKVVGPIINTGTLSVGNNCWIGANLVIRGNGNVVLGNNIDVGPDVTFMTGTHHIGSAKRRAGEGYNCSIIIGNGCWIGGKTTFANNIHIGEGTVIAACSCVVCDLMCNTLNGGVPVKLLRQLEQ